MFINNLLIISSLLINSFHFSSCQNLLCPTQTQENTSPQHKVDVFTRAKIVSAYQQNAALYQESHDYMTLSNILDKSNHLAKVNTWNSKLLFVKFDPGKDPPEFRYYYHNSFYQDRNQNNVQDSSDQGFFNPASTVKVAIAALALEKLNEIGLERQAEYRVVENENWYRIDEDIRQILVISDNDATNRLILWLGFDKINNSFQSKGLHHLVINRLMLDKGTLVQSPPFEVRLKNRVIEQPAKSVSVQPSCYEKNNKIGNCATAIDLIKGLIRITKPEYFRADQNFNLRQHDRQWLQEIMSRTPRQEGLDYADNYCRFLAGLKKEIMNKSVRMLSKCGVALFSNTYTDLSFIETGNGQSYYILFSVNPSQDFSEEAVIQWMKDISELILEQLP